MFSTGITGRSIGQASNGPDEVVSSILNCLCFRAIQADILHNHLLHPFIALYIIQASEHLSFSSWLVWTLFCVLFVPFTRKALGQILCCIITNFAFTIQLAAETILSICPCMSSVCFQCHRMLKRNIKV